MHQTKQAPLLTFTNWPHTGDDSHQLAQPKDSGNLYQLFPIPGRSRKLWFLSADSVFNHVGSFGISQPSHHLYSPTGSQTTLDPSELQDKTDKTDTISLGSSKEVAALDAQVNSFRPQGEAKSWDFLFSHSTLRRGRGSMVSNSPNCCLCPPLGGQIMLDSSKCQNWQDKSQSSGKFSEKS